MKVSLSLLLLSGLLSTALADGPKDNIPSAVRPIPPLGIEVPQPEIEALKNGVGDIRVG